MKVWAVLRWDDDNRTHLEGIHESKEGVLEVLLDAKDDLRVVAAEDRAPDKFAWYDWYVVRSLSEDGYFWNEEFVLMEMELQK